MTKTTTASKDSARPAVAAVSKASAKKSATQVKGAPPAKQAPVSN
jgi:hypothetical protein